MFRQLSAIVSKEFAGYFRTPTAYILIGVLFGLVHVRRVLFLHSSLHMITQLYLLSLHISRKSLLSLCPRPPCAFGLMNAAWEQ